MIKKRDFLEFGEFLLLLVLAPFSLVYAVYVNARKLIKNIWEEEDNWTV